MYSSCMSEKNNSASRITFSSNFPDASAWVRISYFGPPSALTVPPSITALIILHDQYCLVLQISDAQFSNTHIIGLFIE